MSNNNSIEKKINQYSVTRTKNGKQETVNLIIHDFADAPFRKSTYQRQGALSQDFANLLQADCELYAKNLPKGYEYEKGNFYLLKRIEQEQKQDAPQDGQEQPPKQELTETMQRIGTALFIIGKTMTATSHAWSIACMWYDERQNKHIAFVPFGDIGKQNKDWFNDKFFNQGFIGDRKEILSLLTKALHEELPIITLIEKTGWYNRNYITPNYILGNDKSSRLYNSREPKNSLFLQGGNVEAWERVKTLIQGNTRLEFAYLTAFAPILLNLFDTGENTIFCFEGFSSSGKTTALEIASAVWGNRNHIKQWRTTDNALEHTAISFNDNLLVLDELSQIETKALFHSAYMIGNGQTKARLTKSAEAKAVQTFRTICLSSGEKGFVGELASKGIDANAGQEVRFIGIPIEKEHIAELHDMNTASKLVGELKQLTANNYGFEGVKFIEHLIKHYTFIEKDIHSFISKYAESLSIGYESNSQVVRVAKKFALIEYTRYLLNRFGMIGDDFAKDTVKKIFADWLEDIDRNSTSKEESNLLDQVTRFIELHGATRFQRYKDQPIINMAGYIDESEEENIYYFNNTTFKNEICKGYRNKFVCDTLKKHGLLYLPHGATRGNQAMKYLSQTGKTNPYYTIIIK